MPKSGSSLWEVDGNSIIQRSRVFDGPINSNNIIKRGTIALANNRIRNNIRITAKIQCTPVGDVGLVFRYQDENNYYRFSLNQEWGYARLTRCTKGQFGLLAEQKIDFSRKQTHTIEIMVFGNNLSASMDGQKLLNVHDSEHLSGSVGLYNWYTDRARFKALSIFELTDSGDLGITVRSGRWSVFEDGSHETTQITPVSPPTLNSGIRRHSKRALPIHSTLHAIAGESTWQDYCFFATLSDTPTTGFDVVVRYSGPSSYYALRIDPQLNIIQLFRREPTATGLLQLGGAVNVNLGQFPINLQIEVVRDRLTVWIDEQQLFTINDAIHTHGQVGFLYSSNAELEVESATVCSISLAGMELFRDHFDTQDISAWEIIDSGNLQAPSNWVCESGAFKQKSNIRSNIDTRANPKKFGTHAIAGDNSWTDFVLSVQVRSDDNDVLGLVFHYVDEDNFYRLEFDRQKPARRLVKCFEGNFSVLWEDTERTARYKTGQTYDVVVVTEGGSLKAYLDDIPLFLTNDSDLAAGKIGLFSWANQGSVFSKIRVYPLSGLTQDKLLEEHFVSSNIKDWELFTEAGVKGKANWQIQDRRMVQLGNVHVEEARSEISKQATFAVKGNEDWTDYRVTVGLYTKLDNDAIGVMFRYVDPKNYYRFSMDSDRGYRRLIKVVDGNTFRLWEDKTKSYQISHKYLVTIDCLADHLTIYLNGSQLTTVRDSSHKSGKAGFYTYANKGAHFEHIEVIEPSWVSLKKFENIEPPLAAGTVLRIHAEQLTYPDPLPAGTVETPMDQGAPHLPDSIVDCRIVEGNDRVLHSRYFIPAADYSAQPAKILRNADGTKALLIPDSDKAFEDGDYRLSFIYRRIADGTPSFSQDRDIRDELVTIDVVPPVT